MTFVSFALELGRLMMPQLAVLIVLWVLCDFAVGKLNAPRPLVLAVLWLFLLIETLNVGSRVTLFFQSREFQIPKVSLGIQLVLLAVLVGLPAAKYFVEKKFANCGAVSKALALFFHTVLSLTAAIVLLASLYSVVMARADFPAGTADAVCFVVAVLALYQPLLVYFGGNRLDDILSLIRQANRNAVSVHQMIRTMSAQVSKHARKRTKQRAGLGKRAAVRNAQKAFDFGVKHSETRGHLNGYLTSIRFKNKTINNIRVYHRHVYLFAGDVLVTVLNLPNSLWSQAESCEKRKNMSLECPVNQDAAL